MMHWTVWLDTSGFQCWNFAVVTTRPQWQKRIKKKMSLSVHGDFISLKGCHRGSEGPWQLLKDYGEGGQGHAHA